MLHAEGRALRQQRVALGAARPRWWPRRAPMSTLGGRRREADEAGSGRSGREAAARPRRRRRPGRTCRQAGRCYPLIDDGRGMAEGGVQAQIVVEGAGDVVGAVWRRRTVGLRRILPVPGQPPCTSLSVTAYAAAAGDADLVWRIAPQDAVGESDGAIRA